MSTEAATGAPARERDGFDIRCTFEFLLSFFIQNRVTDSVFNISQLHISIGL
jgi:hypothetical protein